MRSTGRERRFAICPVYFCRACMNVLFSFGWKDWLDGMDDNGWDPLDPRIYSRDIRERTDIFTHIHHISYPILIPSIKSSFICLLKWLTSRVGSCKQTNNERTTTQKAIWWRLFHEAGWITNMQANFGEKRILFSVFISCSCRDLLPREKERNNMCFFSSLLACFAFFSSFSFVRDCVELAWK